MKSRICSSCKVEKEIDAFVKCKSSIYTYCKVCQSKKSKLWRQNNREKHLEQQQKYRNKCGYNGRRNTSLKSKYGITNEDYNNLLKLQNYSCAICHGKETYNFDVLVVDHCHDTGEIRGLLCTRCNKGLGMFKDSILSLENAIDYLKG